MRSRPPTLLLQGLAVSLAVHAAVLGVIALGGWLRSRRAPVTMELDMARSAMPPVPAMAKPRPPQPRKDWVASKKGLAPAQSLTETAETDDPAVTCPPPCPDTPGAYLPAGLAAQEPAMLEDMSNDYPRSAEKMDQEGKVTVELFIDTDGKVRQVKLIRGSFEALNNFVIERMRRMPFRPARDAQGNPVAVSYIIPMKFVLQ